MRLIFTALSAAADNRGSLSIHKRLALAVMLLQGASSRQIFGGLRMGAGCLPFAGVGDNREAPAGLMARETTPTRFRLSTKSRGNPAKAAMARLFLYFHKKGHSMPKHNHAQIEQTNQNSSQQQVPAANTEALIDTRCPWTRMAEGSRNASIDGWQLAKARRTASGISAILRVLDVHRDRRENEEQPLMVSGVEGGLFDAATQLIHCLEAQFDGWAEKAGEA